MQIKKMFGVKSVKKIICYFQVIIIIKIGQIKQKQKINKIKQVKQQYSRYLIKRMNKLGNLNFNMQRQSLILKLQHIVQSQNPITKTDAFEPYSNPSSKQIKHQLQNYHDFTYQQIIKLSAYYQTKLQYQSIDYQEQVSCLKQEIQRQYKVIGLMKLQLEDLVVLVNQQRNHSRCNHCKHQQEAHGYSEGEQRMAQQEEYKERMRRQEEHKEWRVKKSQDARVYTDKPTHTNHHYPQHNNKTQHHNNHSQNTISNEPHQHSYTRSASTISGLQIIAQQQTQRTLMSANDQEQYPIDPDYFENDQNNHQQGDKGQSSSQINNQSSYQPINYQMDDCSKEQLKNDQENHQVYVPETHVRIEDTQHVYQEEMLQNQQRSKHEQNNQFSSPISQQQFQDYQSIRQENQFQSQKTLNQNLFLAHVHSIHTNHSSNSSTKPQLKYVENSHQPQVNEQKEQTTYQKTNFVQNPFVKKAPQSRPVINLNYQTQKQTEEFSFFNNQSPQNYHKTKQQQQQSQQQHQRQQQSAQSMMQQARNFLKQYRPQFKQANHPTSKQHNIQKAKSTSSVMSILQLIALNNFQPHSKRSQKSNKFSSSRSKSKGNKQGKKSIQNKSSAKQKKHSSKKAIYYNHQTEEPVQIDSQNNSRFTMVRCPTSQDITSTQRLNPKSFDETDCFTSNDFRDPSEYQSCDKDLRSFHTTFGKPSSSQFLKDPFSVNKKDVSLENFFTNQRKGSIKWKKQPLSLKENFGNKQNERQRRMSQKAPSSKPSSIIGKKQSTKYLKPNASFASEQSVHSMLQSHLQNSNKFLVGVKKQQVKYDGQRMVLGQQQIRHGHGTIYYSNGLIYEGEFFQNKRQGFGLLKFNHVQLYSGQWQGDELCGKGKIRNCAIINKKKKQLTQGLNPNTQNSQLTNSMFVKWISYCGEFMNNRFEGEGTLYLQGGEKFVGWFRNGVADGQGSLYRKNGEVENGVWRNNVLFERHGA